MGAMRWFRPISGEQKCLERLARGARRKPHRVRTPDCTLDAPSRRVRTNDCTLGGVSLRVRTPDCTLDALSRRERTFVSNDTMQNVDDRVSTRRAWHQCVAIRLHDDSQKVPWQIVMEIVAHTLRVIFSKKLLHWGNVACYYSSRTKPCRSGGIGRRASLRC